MKCKNCGHKLVEAEKPVPAFDGGIDTEYILVHKVQTKKKLSCMEGCFCGCTKPELEKEEKKNG